MTVLSPADLLGRAAELTGMADVLDGPGGGAMVVLGEAGSGKTSLLDTATAEAADRGIRALRVTGYEAESHYPYAGLHQLLTPVLDDLARAGDAPEHILSGVLGLPGRAEEPDTGTAAVGAALAGEACQRLLRQVNAQQRTLVIVDDLQWLDTESARALAALCRRLQVPDVDLLLAVRGQLAPEELGIRTREYALAPLVQADAQVLLERATTTLHGHARNTVLLTGAGPTPSAGQRTRVIARCIRGVADLLGDTPAVTRRSYVDPRLVSRYEADGELPAVPLRPAALPVPAEAELAVGRLLADG